MTFYVEAEIVQYSVCLAKKQFEIKTKIIDLGEGYIKTQVRGELMEINICFSSDDNYAQHLGVAIASILKNSSAKDKYNFFIMDGKIGAGNKRKIAKLKNIRDFNITYTEMDESHFVDCPITGYVDYITLPTYYRFKIPSLFSDVDKILYMDCDMIVREDIASLFNTDITDYHVAAVPEVFNHHHRTRLEFEEGGEVLL